MSELRLFDTTVASLYETVLDPQHWNEAIADIARLFAAPSASMFRYNFEACRAYDIRAYGLDPDIGQRYTSYYCQLDPGRSVGMAARVGEWYSDEPLLDLRSPHAREYVHDFALPSGIGRVAGVKVSGDSTSCVWLSLERRPGAARFGDAARQQYLAIEPHLRRVSQMRSKLDALAVGSALARACLDRLHAGVVVVDAGRRIHLVNAHGAHLLDKAHGMSTSNRKLRCGVPSLDEQLGRLIKGACQPRATGGALRIAMSDAVVLLVSVVPIPASHDLSSLLSEPLALVVFSDPNADTTPVDVYQALFALTATEAVLLAGLVRGVTVAKWASQRRVSVATVRSQLRSVFDKTGTGSQARLVALAKSIAPIY